MPHFDDSQREVSFRFAYFGPPRSGRGANVRRLHDAFPSTRRSRLKATEIRGDRSLSFELRIPLPEKRGEAWTLRLFLVALTGEIRSSDTRRKAFAGADGVVFCAPALRAQQAQNREAFREGRHLLAQVNETPPSGVIQFSHMDAEGALTYEEIEGEWIGTGWPLYTAQPKTGDGVRETLGAVFALAYENAKEDMEAHGLSVEDISSSLVAAMRGHE